MTDTRKIAEFCAQKCLEKKAENVIILDLEDKSSVADFFVVCSGFSDRQVAAIADFVSDEARKSGVKVYAEEGMKDGRWALIDLGPVIVHVFQDHLRDFSSLESLWGDAPRILVREDGTTEEVDNIARPSDFEPGSARF
jgi:ribosome-associated protein